MCIEEERTMWGRDFSGSGFGLSSLAEEALSWHVLDCIRRQKRLLTLYIIALKTLVKVLEGMTMWTLSWYAAALSNVIADR